MLNAAFGVSLIGGLASFGGASLFEDPVAVENEEAPLAEVTNASATNPVSPVESPSSSSPDVINNPPEDDVGVTPQVSDNDADRGLNLVDRPEIAAFFAQYDLKRPTIKNDWQARYPDCARTARNQRLAAIRAQACIKEMDVFNSEVLVVYQAEYEAYVPVVQSESFRLEAGPLLDFVLREADGFTNKTLDVAKLYSQISDDWSADLAKLRRQAY